MLTVRRIAARALAPCRGRRASGPRNLPAPQGAGGERRREGTETAARRHATRRRAEEEAQQSLIRIIEHMGETVIDVPRRH